MYTDIYIYTHTHICILYKGGIHTYIYICIYICIYVLYIRVVHIRIYTHTYIIYVGVYIHTYILYM